MRGLKTDTGCCLLLFALKIGRCRAYYFDAFTAVFLQDTVTGIPFGKVWDKPFGTDDPTSGATLYDNARFAQGWKLMLDAAAAEYVTFRLNFHHFDRFELDLHGRAHMHSESVT